MRSTRSQALQIIAGEPAGLTSAALARRLDCARSVASDLASKLSADGKVVALPLPGSKQAKLWRAIEQHESIYP